MRFHKLVQEASQRPGRKQPRRYLPKWETLSCQKRSSALTAVGRFLSTCAGICKMIGTALAQARASPAEARPLRRQAFVLSPVEDRGDAGLTRPSPGLGFRPLPLDMPQ